MSGRKRRDRGLFGIGKKKSVLFTFRPREGEEYSSDSEDSDYFPGRESTDEDDVENFLERQKAKAARKKIKRLKALDSKRSSKRNCKVLKSGTHGQSCTSSKKTPPMRLPPEILLRVFVYGVQLEGITKFLPRVSQVCKQWRETASDPILLRHLDLSVRGEGGDASNGVSRVITLTNQRINKLLSSRDLSQCQMLSLANQDKLSASHIKTVLTLTPRLTSLDLRRCQISTELLKNLPAINPCLERIDLSQVSASSGYLTFTLWEGLVRALGPKLVELRLGKLLTKGQPIQTLIKSITLSFPHLKELDLSANYGINPAHSFMFTTALNMGELAKACPRLTELRLDGHVCVDRSGETQPYSPAFTNLKIFSQSSQVHYPNELQVFYRLFLNNNLLELNISRSNLRPSLLSASQVQSVNKLCLADMRWKHDEAGEISWCMHAWFESIEILDLSGNKMDWFEEELTFFALPENCESTSLKVLNLSNSTVNLETVVSILRNCKCLHTIDLTSCRELPRGCKRVFRKQDFPRLIESLLE